MARIQFSHVDLEYPIREFQGVSLKEFVLHGLFFQKMKERVRSIKALSDLSFEIHDGERVGIIGLNGAGKSTLLRTIGGIFPIRRGSLNVEGSICSLFDIGVGFEQDATGWENIYYRSYLQGETPRTINEKIQEIADFTELGEALKLPLRCYSTGMVMRLAFSIATARNPEILLIDEVFATGDLIFLKKAQGRIRDLSQKAQIVVVVGHDLTFLKDFSTKIIWLHQGRIHAVGPTHEIIHDYTSGGAAQLQRAA